MIEGNSKTLLIIFGVIALLILMAIFGTSLLSGLHLGGLF